MTIDTGHGFGKFTFYSGEAVLIPVLRVQFVSFYNAGDTRFYCFAVLHSDQILLEV